VIIHGITIPIGKGFHTVRTRTSTAPQTLQPRTASSNVKGSNLRAFLPFTHVNGDCGASDAPETDSESAVREGSQANVRTTVAQGSPATASEHSLTADSHATVTSGTGLADPVKTSHGPITWREGNVTVVERDGSVDQVTRGR
jgi:hypothetical protein